MGIQNNKKLKKIYISGAISHNPDYRKQFINKYRELESKWVVLTPLFINARLDWNEYMHIDLAMVDICDAIYMLKGWEESKGATTEHEYAKKKGLQIIYEDKECGIVRSCWNCRYRYLNGESNPCSTCKDADRWIRGNYEV